MNEDFGYPGAMEIAESGSGMSGIPMNAINFFGDVSPLEATRQALAKSLTAGYETNLPDMTGGGAMRVESLEPDLKLLTATEKSFTLFNDLLAAKKKATSTIAQYTSMDSYGEAATYEEGGAPSYEDDTYKRHVVPVKYVGAIGKVTNVMMEVGSLVAPVAQETRAKNLAIMEKSNILCYRGNSSFAATEYDGLLASVQKSAYAATNIIDLKGKRPTIEKFNEAVAIMEDQKGFLTSPRAYMSPSARAQYKAELLRNKYYVVGGVSAVNSEVEAALEGLKSNQVVYDGGEFPLKKDIYLRATKYPRLAANGLSFVATGSTPPATPTITSATPTTDANSTVPAATYNYAVVAINKYGQKSAPAETGDVVVNAGENVTFVLADGSSTSGQEATSFSIYRRATGKASTDYRFLFTVAATTASKVDNGAWMPDTSIIPIVDFDTTEVLAYHQLLDLAKFPLATVVDSIQWMQRLYGAPIIYNPRRIVILINAGDDPN